ncbi:MAG: MFS transporter [Ruminococcaceae bacterium]|nr:MFS transporter [Oscillospiraceae bacterium]
MENRYFKDKRISLLVLSTVMTAYGFLCMTKYCFSAAMVFIVDEGYMTKFETGMISAVFWAVYAVIQLFGGVLADKFRPEKQLAISLLGSGIINLAIYFCYENYILTMVLWSLNAILQFSGWPASFKIVSSMVHESQRQAGTVIITIMSPIGVLFSYVVAALVAHWQQNFIISSIGSFLLMIAWLITAKYTNRFVVTEQILPEDKKNTKVGDAPQVSFLRLAFSSGLIFFLVLTFLRSFITQIQTLIPVMINESYEGVQPAFATVLSFVVLVCNVLGPILANKLAYFFRNEMLATALMFALTIPAAFFTLLLGSVNYWFIIAATALIVLCASANGYFTMTLASVAFVKWGKGGTVAGITNAAAAFGIVGANFALTLIADKFGWIPTLITLISLIVFGTVLALIGTPVWKKFKNLT